MSSPAGHSQPPARVPGTLATLFLSVQTILLDTHFTGEETKVKATSRSHPDATGHGDRASSAESERVAHF